MISIHALRGESDFEELARGGSRYRISIHALREESDLQKQGYKRRMVISIHALREEGDALTRLFLDGLRIFQSTPSARRATHGGQSCSCYQCDFNPRPPRGGRRQDFVEVDPRLVISIHDLREEGAQFRRILQHGTSLISIHALREEGDGASVKYHVGAV